MLTYAYRSVEIDSERSLNICTRHVSELPTRSIDARVVYEDVKPTDFLGDGFDGGCDIALAGHIQLDRLLV